MEINKFQAQETMNIKIKLLKDLNSQLKELLKEIPFKGKRIQFQVQDNINQMPLFHILDLNLQK